MTTFIDVTSIDADVEVELEQTVIVVTPGERDVAVDDANVIISVSDVLVDATAEPITVVVGTPDDLITIEVDSVAGPAGDSASVTVGTTSTGAPGTQASVVNVGTDSAAVFDFTIPRGDAGSGDGIAPIVFDQPTQSAMWHVVHGQGFNPNVVVRRTDGTTVAAFGSVYSSDANTVDLYFGDPITGVATLNF